MLLQRLLSLAVVALLASAAVPSATLAAAPSPVVVSHGPRWAKIVALTFDDGWGSANCQEVVNILLKTRTPATFLPTAQWVVLAPAFWRSVADLGFPIANHTTDHPLMTGLAYADQYQEIDGARSTIERITGHPMIRVFRPPFGAYSAVTREAAAAAGFPVVMNWDTSFADTSRRPGGDLWPLAAYFSAATKGTRGSIILGHCGSPVDYQILASVIASYRSRGFTFVTVPQMLRIPAPEPMTLPAGAADADGGALLPQRL